MAVGRNISILLRRILCYFMITNEIFLKCESDIFSGYPQLCIYKLIYCLLNLELSQKDLKNVNLQRLPDILQTLPCFMVR